MGRSATTGLSAVGFAVGGYVMPLMFPKLDPLIGYSLLTVAFLMIVAAFVLWIMGRRAAVESPTSSVSASGKHPTAIGINHGTVNVHQGVQDATQHRKEAKVHDPARQIIAPPAPLPDIVLGYLLMKVYKKLGPSPQGEAEREAFHRRVNREIADTVKLRGLHVWGYRGERPIEPILPYEWNKGSFDHRNKELCVTSGYPDPRTYAYVDLKFNKAEIDRHWPEPLRTTNNERP